MKRTHTKRQDSLEHAFRKEEEWIRKVPPVYRCTDPHRIPKALLERVMDWRYGPTGLVLSGPTGTFKTRVLYERVRKLHFEEGKTWVSFGSRYTFGDIMTERYLDSSTSGGEWIRWLGTKVDVVMFEDLGKVKFTDRVGEALYRLIEIRTAHLRPLLIACNTGPAELVSRLGNDRGLAVVRRLRDFCEVLTLNEKAEIVDVHTPCSLMECTLRRRREEQKRLEDLAKEFRQGARQSNRELGYDEETEV